MNQRNQWCDPLPNAAATTFWGSLGAEDRSALDAAGEVKLFSRGAALCHQGYEPAHVFVVYSGRVEVFLDNPAGYRTVLARRGPGHIIGELSAIDRCPMSATVNAVEPVRSLTIAASRFAALCQIRPRIAWLLLQNTVARRRATLTAASTGPTSAGGRSRACSNLRNPIVMAAGQRR